MRRWVALFAMLVLLSAACGNDDDSTGEATPEPTQPTQEPATATTAPTATTVLDYETLDGLVLSSDGGFELRVGLLANSVGLSGCINASSFTLNDEVCGYHELWFEHDAGSGWQEVEESQKTGGLCGYDLNSAPPGKYRVVVDTTIAGVRGIYKSKNAITK